MVVDKKALFPLVRPGHCQQLHPFIFMWWEENFTQRFSSHPYQRDAGTVWAWATTIHAAASTNTRRLDTCHNKHWPGRNPKQRCRVCSARGVMRTVVFRCVKCDMALCVDRSCFEDYHTKNDLQDIFSFVLHADCWSLDHNVSKRTWIFTTFFRNVCSTLHNKDITGILSNVWFLPYQLLLSPPTHTNLSLSLKYSSSSKSMHRI